MAWSKPKDKEPTNQDNEYFLRNGGDKYIGWWDNDEKEFYMIEKDAGMTYFEKDQYPNIEWWEEEEPNQNEQGEMISDLGTMYTEYGFSNQDWDDFVKDVLKKYQLIRK